MKRIRKGCLSRPRNDVKSDGSRIEGTHKAWNSLNRAFASGLQMMLSLGHDFVLRRNIRLAFNGSSPSAFVSSTYGSHHISLVNHNAMIWNSLLERVKQRDPGTTLKPLPTLHEAGHTEKFGLVLEKGADSGAAEAVFRDVEGDVKEAIVLVDSDDEDGGDDASCEPVAVSQTKGHEIAREAPKGRGAARQKPMVPKAGPSRTPAQHNHEVVIVVDDVDVDGGEEVVDLKGKGKEREREREEVAEEFVSPLVHTRISSPPLFINDDTFGDTDGAPAASYESQDLALLDDDTMLQLGLQISAMELARTLSTSLSIPSTNPYLQPHGGLQQHTEPYDVAIMATLSAPILTPLNSTQATSSAWSRAQPPSATAQPISTPATEPLHNPLPTSSPAASLSANKRKHYEVLSGETNSEGGGVGASDVPHPPKRTKDVSAFLNG